MLRQICFGIVIVGILGEMVSGQVLFVVNSGNGTIGEYDATTGAAINPTLISGLSNPTGIAISGDDIFVENNDYPIGVATYGWVGEYSISGQPINPTLIPRQEFHGLGALAVSGSSLYVTSGQYGDPGSPNAIMQYSTAGQFIQQTGIELSYGIAISLDGNDIYTSQYATNDSGSIGEATIGGIGIWHAGWPGYSEGGLAEPEGVAVTDSDVYVEETGLGGGRIDEYTLSGDRVTNFGTGVGESLATYGSYLYASTYNGIAEFTTSGQLVNQSFITGLNGSYGIAVFLPEPGFGALFGAALLIGSRRYRRP